MNDIKQKNVEYQKLCDDSEKIIKATYDPEGEGEILFIMQAWEDMKNNEHDIKSASMKGSNEEQIQRIIEENPKTCDIEFIKNKHIEILKTSTSPIKYIEKQISEIEERSKRKYTISELAFKTGFDTAVNGITQIEKTDLFDFALSGVLKEVLEGFAASHNMKFLSEELRIHKEGKVIINKEKDLHSIENSQPETKSNLKSKELKADQDKIKKITILPKILPLLVNELKVYFPEKEIQIETVLNGGTIEDPLLFPHNQNKLVEVFLRLKYNNHTPNNSQEINDWLCENFKFQYKKGKNKEVRPFNKETVRAILTKGKGWPKPMERILKNIEWLPYKAYTTLQQEEKKDKA